MEEKDVNSIASAVTNALSKLNADTTAAAAAKETAEKRSGNKSESNENEAEAFKCPDCDAPVKGGIAYCQECGCLLEWGE